MKHLWLFLLFLVIAGAIKMIAIAGGVTPPPLAAWELAALAHVFAVAWQMMDFGGFTYATPRFNSWFKKLVLVSMGVLFFLKLVLVIAESTQGAGNDPQQPIIHFSPFAQPFERLLQRTAPFIIVVPLFFFLVANVFALHHIKKQARALGFSETLQECHLRWLIRFVDLPVVVPFTVLFLYLRIDPIAQHEGEVFGIIGCCLLIVSNLLTGVFAEHWEKMNSRFTNYELVTF